METNNRYPINKDVTSMKRIDFMHPFLRPELCEIYHRVCLELKGKAICRFSHTLRSFAEQNALFAQGRTKPGAVVTWAKAGESYHNYGLAVDIVLLLDKNGDGHFEEANWQTDVDFDGDGIADWLEVVKVFKMYGWEWGGDWNGRKSDRPHFQKTFGYSVRQLLQLHSTGKKDAAGYVTITPKN